MNTPQSLYLSLLDSGTFSPDPAQAHLVRALDALAEQISQPARPKTSRTWWPFSAATTTEPAPARGLYVWGGVGRGKTRLVDLLAEAEVPGVQRWHFHRFMAAVHEALGELVHQTSPLQAVAEQFLQRGRLLVLDEMHIVDITDAMLMYGLLEALFAGGGVLVTTSNRPPDDLYLDGLQRARFLPAIDLLHQHCTVLPLDSEQDYRLRALSQAGVYCLGEDTAPLLAHWQRLVGCAPRAGFVEIHARQLPVIGVSPDTLWASFDALCNTPRSARDYIAIANDYRSVLVQDIPVLDDQRGDEARRLLNLVDEFYDHGVKFICSAAAPPEQLYTGGPLRFEFERCASRLIEMQSQEYLGSAHRKT